jgi:hypothetical protein
MATMQKVEVTDNKFNVNRISIQQVLHTDDDGRANLGQQIYAEMEPDLQFYWDLVAVVTGMHVRGKPGIVGVVF